MIQQPSLSNHLLIAMPQLKDPNFHQAVVYICENQPEGTVGLIINRPLQMPMGLVFEQMHIQPVSHDKNALPLMFGGPIQPERGFVIHRPSGSWTSSLVLQEDVNVTTSQDIIRAIAADTGPRDALVTLGYTGWDARQLEQELLDNLWLVCPYAPELLYDVPFAKRWEMAGRSIGVNMHHLGAQSGHA
ncbi:MAG: YqgE/AlgH family protein [Legionellaceae bacterium]|nr:YqgE/AlgH family protein [Legionellaceae bacterium]